MLAATISVQFQNTSETKTHHEKNARGKPKIQPESTSIRRATDTARDRLRATTTATPAPPKAAILKQAAPRPTTARPATTAIPAQPTTGAKTACAWGPATPTATTATPAP